MSSPAPRPQMVMRFVSAAEGPAQRACEPCTSIRVGVVSELWAGGEAGDLEGLRQITFPLWALFSRQCSDGLNTEIPGFSFCSSRVPEGPLVSRKSWGL